MKRELTAVDLLTSGTGEEPAEAPKERKRVPKPTVVDPWRVTSVRIRQSMWVRFHDIALRRTIEAGEGGIEVGVLMREAFEEWIARHG